jgi:DNA-binding NtrC family response regulator
MARCEEGQAMGAHGPGTGVAQRVGGRARRSPSLGGAGGRRPCVLVAEDDDDLRELLCEELRREGNEVVGCASVREAVRRIEWILALAGDPWALDVVVTDLRLGDIDGLALLARIHEAGVDVPVVLMSGFGDWRIRARAGRLGAAGFLDKPLEAQTLRRLVAQLAQERQRRLRRRGAGEGGPSA